MCKIWGETFACSLFCRWWHELSKKWIFVILPMKVWCKRVGKCPHDESIGVRSKMDGPPSERSRESGRSIQKWKVLSQTGRSFVQKWTFSDDNVRYSEPKWTAMSQSGRSLWLKIDGPKESKWTVGRYKIGTLQGIKVDGPMVSKWTANEYKSGQSNGIKVEVKNKYKKSPWQKKSSWAFLALTLITTSLKYHTHPH